jgi:hypothetical protein
VRDHAFHADFAAHCAHELLADRKAESCATRAPFGTAGLLERLENRAELVGRDADA